MWKVRNQSQTSPADHQLSNLTHCLQASRSGNPWAATVGLQVTSVSPSLNFLNEVANSDKGPKDKYRYLENIKKQS